MDAIISIVACLKGGSRGIGACSTSKPLSSNDSLRSVLSSQTIKDLLGQVFMVEHATKTLMFEVNDVIKKILKT